MNHKIAAALAFTLTLARALSVNAADVKPSTVFSGAGLPIAPQQHAAWPHPKTKLPETLLKSVDLLFAQGMADPRGGEYRQIECVTGNCWRGDGGIVKTHAWVFSTPDDAKQQFAVCWNGLIYPLVSAGEKADLSADVVALTHAKGEMPMGVTPEASAVEFTSVLPVKVLLLLRLGEVDTAEQLWPLVKPSVEHDPNGQPQPDDPYLRLASEWCWYSFDRAVCAHMWGNDVVSRDTAQLLTDALPQVEATAKEIGYKRPLRFDPHNFNHEIPNPPFISFAEQLPTLLADEQRRVKDGAIQRVLDDPTQFPDKPKRIAALIRDLELVSARQWGQPGGVGLDDDPVPQALIKEGADAVEPLIDCLERDNRLTRSVSFGRDFSTDRNLLPVRGAAYAVLQRILQTETFGPASDRRNRGGDGNAKAIAAEIREFVAKSKGKSVAERWYDTLADDAAGPSRWVEAAKHIVEPADVERRGQWISEPSRKPGEIAPMKGEALRAKLNPSVSELMAKRVPTTAAERDGWLFAQSNAADLALCLHRWDAPAAVPSLREQMLRCMDASDRDRKQIRPDPGWAQSTQTTEQMARDVGRLATALAESGDSDGTLLYRNWVVTQTPAMPGGNVGELLRPMWRFPDEPNLSAAAEELFNGESSLWRCLPTAVQFRDWGPMQLMSSPVYALPAFRKHLARDLDVQTNIGTAQVKDHSLNISMQGGSSGYGGINMADPLLPKPADATVAVRVCDWYAWNISKLNGAPAYELYWPIEKRDEQRPQLKAFLDRWGDRFRYTPIQNTLDRGFTDADRGRMTFPKLDHPATDADVAASIAIFSLHNGPARIVALDAWPAKAKWVTLKDYPIQIQGATDPKTGVTKYYDDFLNSGYVWQTEEVEVNGKWERYYGFVGPHVIAKVPAEQIEFLKEK